MDYNNNYYPPYHLPKQGECKIDGKELAEKHLNLIKEAVKAYKEIKQNTDERKIYELSVKEFKELMIECFEELEQHKLETTMKEYNNLFKDGKPGQIFMKGGEQVPQEW